MQYRRLHTFLLRVIVGLGLYATHHEQAGFALPWSGEHRTSTYNHHHDKQRPNEDEEKDFCDSNYNLLVPIVLLHYYPTTWNPRVPRQVSWDCRLPKRRLLCSNRFVVPTVVTIVSPSCIRHNYPATVPNDSTFFPNCNYIQCHPPFWTKVVLLARLEQQQRERITRQVRRRTLWKCIRSKTFRMEISTVKLPQQHQHRLLKHSRIPFYIWYGN